MRVITGSHEVKTGRKDKDGNAIMETVVDAVEFADEPKKLGDIPEKAIAAVGKPNAAGNVTVVTKDGKKLVVAAAERKAAKEDKGTAAAGIGG